MQSTPRFSTTLMAVLNANMSDRITLGFLVAGMKDQARASLIILFALPNTLPSLPGTSAVTGLPLLYLTLQMLLNRNIHLPAFLTERSLPRLSLLAGVARAMPALTRIETMLRPRLLAITTGIGLRLIGWLCLMLSVLIMLPIPFANILPAISLVLIGLGILEHDGVFTLAGVALAFGSILLVIVIYWTLIVGALTLM